MDKKIDEKTIESYTTKFGVFVKSLVYANETYEREIAPKFKKNRQLGIVWRAGAFDGVLIHFLRTLEGDEHKISDMVFNRITQEHGKKAKASADDYMEAALVVLDSLGCHIPVPEDK